VRERCRGQAAIQGEEQMKSAKRNSTEGALDRMAGRVMEMIGKLTGRTSTRATGRAARTRGTGRRQTARAKSRAGR